MPDLRKDFFEIMCELAEKDKDIIVLVGDLGYNFYEDFAKRFPEQFINAGCAEQNMIGVAAGLALGGKKPFVYSGSIFLASRGHEFIRDDVAYANLNVKLVGTGASGFLGHTHNWQGTENELDLLKNLPNLQISFPKDKEELKKALINEGASYIRI
ncbi:hypothetical protein M0R04_10850 [Candidatus Dojkabacteria bacterium]|jgi:transketolase|nr:hypothetical protein [Candidatus Dojkabacteria bacterium]